MHHQSVKIKQCQGKFFYHSSCKTNVSTHIFNYKDALHSDNLILLTSAKVVLDRRPQNTFSKDNAPCVLLSLMPMCPFLNGCCLVRVCFLGFVHFPSSSSVSCSHLQAWELSAETRISVETKQNKKKVRRKFFAGPRKKC